VGTFYYKRWEIFIDELRGDFDKEVNYRDPEIYVWGRPKFYGNKILSKIADFEKEYVSKPPKMSKEVKEDAIFVALELLEKYKLELKSQPKKAPESWLKMKKVNYDMGN